MNPDEKKALLDEALKLTLVHNAFEGVHDKLGWIEGYRIFSPHTRDLLMVDDINTTRFLVCLGRVCGVDQEGLATSGLGISPGTF